MIDTDSRLKSVFSKPPKVCFKRPPNIKDMICRAKLPPKRSYRTRVKKPGYRRCDKPTCRLCPYSGLEPSQVRESTSFFEETVAISSVIDCQTQNLLYKLECTKQECVTSEIPSIYLGETSKSAEVRTVGHLNTILQNYHASTRTPVGLHFQSAGHSHTDLQVTPFERIYSRNAHVRKAREAYMIDKFQLLTKGLNRYL